MKSLRTAQILMVITILLIAAVQAYWLTKLYANEKADLRRETDVTFRETVYKLQVAMFKKDTLVLKMFDDVSDDNLFRLQGITAVRRRKDSAAVRRSGKADTAQQALLRRPFSRRIIVAKDSIVGDSIRKMILRKDENGSPVVRVYYAGSKDSLPFIMGDSSFQKALVTVVKNVRSHNPAAQVSSDTAKPGKVKLSKPATITEAIMPGALADTSDKGLTSLFTKKTTAVDTLPDVQIDSAFKADLRKAGINLAFTISKSDHKDTTKAADKDALKTSEVSVGLFCPYYYRASFGSPAAYILQKIAPQISFTALLMAFTIISFVLLYRNMMAQKRLADIKNEFISNITHELKTPIATVNVAIEAMQNFNVLQNPERTKEYLGISAMELQRLSLLVDKVLKLSMFEKKEIELKKHSFDMQQLVMEVMASMKLQFEKSNADVTLDTEGEDFTINADRLHITSVIYNLLDNALKYSKSAPVVQIKLKEKGEKIMLEVEDNGMGIPAEYKGRIFEKFFRVPLNDTHNIKGYGLGLSYVSHIVQRHHGTIKVESEAGKGSRFIIELPKHTA